MILTVDLGTSVTKVGLWARDGVGGDDGLVAMGRAEVATTRPRLGWAEQDPADWWRALLVAAADTRQRAPQAFASVEVVGFTAARQTFVPVTGDGDPIGPGILWSDRRALAEASALAEVLAGPSAVHARTGVPLESGAVAPKLAWLAAHEPDRLAGCRWLLSPRDLLGWRLTGELGTDPSMAGCMGLQEIDGGLVPELGGPAVGRLAPVVASNVPLGVLRPGPAAELGLPVGIPVVLGAGDRQCEVLGSGASFDRPMVSWGTTANVSMPLESRPDRVPDRVMLSRSAHGGWQLEAGLAAAGSWLAWLARLTGRPVAELVDLAATSPAGARGVVAAPWLDGARAPWWNDHARGAFVGLGADHDVADLARAAVESVAWDVARSIAALTGSSPPVGLALAGQRGTSDLWGQVLTAVTGLGATRRRSGEAASAGAALLAAEAIGRAIALDALDPVVDEQAPDPTLAERYRGLAPAAAAVAEALVRLPVTAPDPPLV